MDTGLLGGLVFIVVFAGMILVHEVGHFTAARLFKIEVEEFGIGFPPRVATLFTWKGTRFSLNWIPLGGFVRPKGENDPEVAGGMAAAKPWKRIGVLVAGPLMNLLVAVFAYSLLFSQVGIPDLHTAVIVDVSAGSPAEQAGLVSSDIVLAAGGQHVTSADQLVAIGHQSVGQALDLAVLRDGEIVELTLTPRANPPPGEGPMGAMVGSPLVPAPSWFSALPVSFWATGEDIGSLLSLPGRIIAGTVSPQEAQVGGPRSMWNLFQAAVTRDVESRKEESSGQAQAPTYYTLLVIIAMSISLGTLNLLPMPALDGGRILLSLPELIIRKRIPSRFENWVHGIGFVLLVALLLVFYVKDFVSPLTINLQ